jgi:hypothetical protein
MIRKQAKIHYLLSLLQVPYLAEAENGPALSPGKFAAETIIDNKLTFTAEHIQGELIVYSPFHNPRLSRQETPWFNQ